MEVHVSFNYSTIQVLLNDNARWDCAINNKDLERVSNFFITLGISPKFEAVEGGKFDDLPIIVRISNEKETMEIFNFLPGTARLPEDAAALCLDIGIRLKLPADQSGLQIISCVPPPAPNVSMDNIIHMPAGISAENAVYNDQGGEVIQVDAEKTVKPWIMVNKNGVVSKLCVECGEYFADLLKHRYKHAPGHFQCKYCPKYYTRPDNLTSHVKKRHY